MQPNKPKLCHNHLELPSACRYCQTNKTRLGIRIRNLLRYSTSIFPKGAHKYSKLFLRATEETRLSQKDPVAKCYQEVEDGDDVLGVDGLDGPLLLTPLEAQHLVGETQDDPQLVALTLLRLGHLWNLELLAG